MATQRSTESSIQPCQFHCAWYSNSSVGATASAAWKPSWNARWRTVLLLLGSRVTPAHWKCWTTSQKLACAGHGDTSHWSGFSGSGTPVVGLLGADMGECLRSLLAGSGGDT